MLKWHDQRILITGATGGIGRELASQLANMGATLLLTGTNTQLLSTITEGLSGQGHQWMALDLSNEQHLQKLFGQMSHMQINVLINLAGVNKLGMIDQTSDEEINQLIQLNLNVPIKLSKEFARQQGEHSPGMLVNIGSILGSIGYPGSSVYCATKFGLRGFTESLTRELAQTKVKVVYVAPRATNTEMNTELANRLNQALHNHVDAPEFVAKNIIDAMSKNVSNARYLGWPEKLFVRINQLIPALVTSSIIKQLPIIQSFLGSKAGEHHEITH